MNVSQMLAHCVKPMAVSLGDEHARPAGFFMRLMGRMVKNMVTSPKPYKQNLPTDPTFVTLHQEHTFEEARQSLLNMIDRYIAHQHQVADIPHPFFGKLTQKEWGCSQYKHLDHHLNQFGV